MSVSDLSWLRGKNHGLTSGHMNLRYTLLALFATVSIVYMSSIPAKALWGHGSITEQVVSNLAHIPVYALLAFLWFNINPARFYMGDTGAMSLGVTLGIIAMLTNTALILPIIGFVFAVIIPGIFRKIMLIFSRATRLR